MRFLRRVLLLLCFGVPVLLAAAGTGLYLWLRTSLPQTQGEITVTGLGAPVDIHRDGHGIPHIRAASQEDAYVALGFVHAQDRLWQMDLTRRVVDGRLAEIGGARLLAHDRAMRTLDLGRRARAGFDILPAPVKAALQAYARGVNAWMTSHGGALPPEFYVARVTPAPWSAADSLLWGKFMGLRLTTNYRREALRAELSSLLAADKLNSLWPPYPADAPVTVPAPRRQALRPGPRHLPSKPPPGLAYDALNRALPAPAAATASNSWAVAGARSATGKPIVAGDPHLGFRAPNLWYLARVSAPGLDLTGATLPGAPFHILGHNGSIGWTFTTTGADTADLVIEKTAAGKPGAYLSPDGPKPFATRTETIKVKDGAPVPLTVRETANGPVISDLGRHAIGVGLFDSLVALRAAVLAPGDRTAQALYDLNRARDWQDFRRALGNFHAPVQNVIYGDVHGRIGFQMVGRVPIRRSGDGSLPVDGSDQSKTWSGFIPFDEMPRLSDPDSGVIINANNRAVGPGYRHMISRDWDLPYRAKRIAQQLSTPRRHDVAASAALQMDNLSLAAQELIPLLLARTPRTERTGPALDELRHWDALVLRRRVAPLIFHTWTREIVRGMVNDELGPLARRYTRTDPLFIRHALEDAADWCDDVTTPAKESCGAVLSSALDSALDELAEKLGPDINTWRWGDLHVARFRNRTLSLIPVIDRLANIEIATDGDTYTLNRGTTRASSRRDPYAHAHGATLRTIYDFSNLDNSLFMHPTGQSGNLLSPYYRDLIEHWRDGRYLKIPSDPPADAELLRLVPKRG